MKPMELPSLEKRILATLRTHREIPPSELVNIVIASSPEISDVEVKRALWRLISNKLVYLSPEQLLGPTPEPQKESAAPTDKEEKEAA
jgi:hypothetical protein